MRFHRHDDKDNEKNEKNGAKTIQNDPKTIQNGSKNENKNFWNNMYFYEVFEKLCNNRALHTSPRWSKKVRKKKQEKTKCVSNERSRHDDQNEYRIIKSGAILEG